METLFIDQSSWSQIRVSGDDCVRFLQGMCTTDVAKLEEGDWARALILNAKGRVLAVVDVVCRAAEFVLVCEPGLGQGVVDTLSKFAIVDDVDFEVADGQLHRAWPDRSSVWTAPPVFEAVAGGKAASDEATEVRRIEAGYPRYGIDITEANFPFESGIGQYVDYKKGCFVGQEPVARVHARAGGLGTKILRGLAIEGDGVKPGLELAHPDKTPAGTVSSVANSSEFGLIALAYVHKTVWEPGTELDAGGCPAVVHELPFGGV